MTTTSALRVINNEEEEGDEDTTAVTISTSTGATTAPFEKLFQSTLQRAYSTTAALGSIKNSSSNDGTQTTTDKSIDVSTAVNSIMDTTIVETTTTTSASASATDENSNTKENTASTVDSLLDTTIAAIVSKKVYSKRTKTKKQRQAQEHHSKKDVSSGRYEFPFATSYRSHPALNNVALAHALWTSVVRPNTDCVIDATCGNGNDSIVLAEILLANESEKAASTCELLCVDVQELACERTTSALREVLPPSVIVIGPNDENKNKSRGTNESNKLVRVLNESHERLPRPNDEASVGLIVYNLGWLPGSNQENFNGKECVTTMETTLSSLVDATSLLRVGGMLSVVTYPQTGPDEDATVKLFVTCLALLSSRTRTWQQELEKFSVKNNKAIAEMVTSAMESVVARGDQTWRVSQHDKLGMDRPPVLFTATRIK